MRSIPDRYATATGRLYGYPVANAAKVMAHTSLYLHPAGYTLSMILHHNSSLPCRDKIYIPVTINNVEMRHSVNIQACSAMFNCLYFI